MANEFGFISNDKGRILSTLISGASTVLAAAEARLLVAPTPNSTRWEKREKGIVCFVKDNTKRSYFIRIYDLQQQRMCFEQRIHKNFEYDMSTKVAVFHTFYKNDGCQVGLKFTDQSGAEYLGLTIEEKLWERKLKDPKNLDPHIKALLRSVGVTEDEYNDRDTRIFIYKFISRIKADSKTSPVKKQPNQPRTVRNRPLPAVPPSEKPPDDRRPSLIQYDDLPPPVPDRPDKSSPPQQLTEKPIVPISRNNSLPLESHIKMPVHPPPPIPTQTPVPPVSHNTSPTLPPTPQPPTPPRKPIKREPPPQPKLPPLPERKPKNGASRPRDSEGENTPVSVSVPSQPPSTLRAPPSPAPQGSARLPETSRPRDREGQKPPISVSVPPLPPPTPPTPPSPPLQAPVSPSTDAQPSERTPLDNQPRAAVLAEIIRGIKLNPVSQPSENSSKQASEDMNPFFSALQMALKQRERAIQDNGELSPDEEDDADYWSD